MRKKHRRAITELLRRFAIREDRAELGNNTGARFKSKLIDPRKGTPASYIAKYVSKNIDGRGLGDTVSRRRVNHYVIVPSTSLRGHRCTVFNNFVFLGFQAARRTAVTIVRIAGNSCNENQQTGRSGTYGSKTGRCARCC